MTQGLSSNNNRIAKNTLFLYIRMAFVLVVSLYTSRVILRTLGVEDFGVFNVVAGFVSMFSFLNSALSSGIQRFYNYELGKNGEDGLRHVYRAAIIIQATLAVVVFILVEAIGIWYIDNKLVIDPERLNAARWVFHLSVVSLIFVILQIPYSSAILAYEKMDFYAVVGVLEVLLKLGIVISLPYFPFDKLILYAILILVIHVFCFVLYFGYVKLRLPVFKLIRGERIQKPLVRSMLGFSGWHVFGTFASVMKDQGLNMVLNFFFGPVVNAARGISYQVQSALTGFVQNITMAARPQMVQSYAQDNVQRTRSLMFSISKFCFIALFLMVLPLSYEIDYVLKLWLGADTVPDNTGIFTVIILAIALIDVLNTPVSMVVHATGKMRNYQVVTSVLSLLSLPVAFFVLRIGTPAVAAFVVCFVFRVINQVVSILILRRIVSFPFKDYFKQVVLPLSVLIIFTSWPPMFLVLFIPEGLLRLLLTTVVSIVAVVLISYFGCLNISERNMVKGFTQSIVGKR